MKQFKININDLFEKSEVETMMDDVEKSSIIYEMNNINQKVLNEISTYANNRERIQNLTDEFTEIMYHERISNNDVERIDYIFDQLVHHIGLDAPVLAACTNTIFNTINEYKEEYIQDNIQENTQQLNPGETPCFPLIPKISERNATKSVYRHDTRHHPDILRMVAISQAGANRWQ